MRFLCSDDRHLPDEQTTSRRASVNGSRKGLAIARSVTLENWSDVQAILLEVGTDRPAGCGQSADNWSVARVLTGVRWNGPRFFELREGASA